MSQRIFGSPTSTGRKLEIVQYYLESYQKALKRQPFRTLYVDGFAGSGSVPVKSAPEMPLVGFDEEVREAIAGSATRALSISRPFSEYFFIERKKSVIGDLNSLSEAHKDKCIHILHGDANQHVRDICRQYKNARLVRGVVLLDPFGSQVEWETIVAIAETRIFDFWYLFPAGLCVSRQISSKGTVDPTHMGAINRIYGTDEWQADFLKKRDRNDLFDTLEITEKDVDPSRAAEFMIGRMRKVFKGGVGDFKIPLGGRGHPWYYLLFAWGNPSVAAANLAKNLSRYAVRPKGTGNGRQL